MALDTSFSSEYLCARFGEDPLPAMKRSGKLRGRPDGFDEELIQPAFNLKLPMPTDQLSSFILRILGAPGNQTIRTEQSGGTGGSGGTGSGTSGSGTSMGASLFPILNALSPNVFGDAPLGHAQASGPGVSLPLAVATLWPPHPSAMLITDPAGLHNGPPYLSAQTPFEAFGTISAAGSQSFLRHFLLMGA